MKKSSQILKYLALFLIVFLFGWESSSYYIVHRAQSAEIKETDVSPIAALSSILSNAETNGSTQEEEADMKVFWRVWRLLGEKYVDESSLDSQQMVYGAIKGMVGALNDPYTVYMDPSETKDFDENLAGQLEGIGAELTVRDQALVVVSPLKDSPAEKAGLKPGDIVYKIDGKLTSEMTVFDAIMNIRGPKGTKVVLTILRKEEKEPLEVGIVRDTVNVESVSMEEKKNKIFYISINQFNDNTFPAFQAKLNEMLLKDPKGLIIDLRNNGGGYLDIAVDILSELIKGKKVAVTIKQKESSNDETLYVSGKPLVPDLPLVVLINNGSASASEILAGAVQDHKRGLILGEQSFGKGSVQEVDDLSDGSSIRITIAKWYTPSGKNIDKVGIKPDMEVELKEEDAKKDIDTQLEAAIKYLDALVK
ncbi:MAG TPA: S41 family peptidase [Candidatus Gracilibacteria bacterium]|nr:S41 family peptidase [Candidatus Gracilibacteria bacterium]